MEIDRRRVLKYIGLGAIALAGGLGTIFYGIGHLWQPAPLANLPENLRQLIYPVFQRGSQVIYFSGETRHKLDKGFYADNGKSLKSVVDKEGIDAVFLEGPGGKIGESDLKIFRAARAKIEEYDRLVEEGKITYAGTDVLIENEDVVLMDVDYPFPAYNPVTVHSLNLRDLGSKVNIYGIDDSDLYHNSVVFGAGNDIEWVLLMLSREETRKVLPKKLLEKEGRIVPKLKQRLEELKRKYPIFDANEKDIDDADLRQRDYTAVQNVVKIMDDSNYRRALMIRGCAHRPTIRRYMADRGFTELK